MLNESSEVEQEVMEAERAVDDARERLSSEIEAASATGRRAIAKVMHQSRPVLIGIAVVAGVAVLAGTVQLVRGAFSRPRQRYFFRPYHNERPSVAGQLIRSVLTSVAGSLATAVARRAIESLDPPSSTQSPGFKSHSKAQRQGAH